VIEAISKEVPTLATLLVKEQGKPLAMATREIQGCLLLLQKAMAIETAETVYSDTEARRIVTHRRPVGVVAAISPWNLPLFLSVLKWAPAIVLGNTVVVKPSPHTPLCSLHLAKLCRDLLPKGVLNVVAASDRDGVNIGKHLASHPDVDKVAFTGSVETGKAVLRSGAAGIKRITLELGGNDAAIVRSDCDVDAIAPKLFMSAFANSGQICCAVKRVFVQESKLAALQLALVRCAKDASTKMGDGFASGIEYGPLNNRAQLERVESLVADARARGCAILCGGQRRDGGGYFYEPTIVGNIREGVGLFDEEQFGPVLPITPYATDDEAIERANHTNFGLGASVWSADVDRANELASRLLAGTVWVNAHAEPTLAPFGGFKQSGIGREFGEGTIDAYTEMQTLSLPQASKAIAPSA